MSRLENNGGALPQNILIVAADPSQMTAASQSLPAPHDQDPGANAPIVIPNVSGLYVDHGRWLEGPEVPKEISPLYYDGLESATSVPQKTSGSRSEVASTSNPGTRIFGLRRSIFWGLIMLAVVILGAALGGGVGAGLANEQSRATFAVDAASAPNSALIQSSSPSLITSPTPPSTLGSSPKRMGFSVQIWEKADFQGRSQVFYSPGFFQTAFLAKGYVWRPGSYTKDMEKCSMSLCHDDFWIGWRGSTPSEKPEFPQNITSGANSVIIACAANFADPGCPGPLSTQAFSTAPVIAVFTPSSTRSASRVIPTRTI